ncbi:MAG: glycosyltransferase [Thomasclavelia sp.]
MSKKIIYTIGQMGNGGAERVISILANASSKENEITIITLFSKQLDYKLNENVNYLFIDVSDLKNPLHRFFKRLFLIRKEINKISPDIIISFLSIVNIYILLSLLFSKYRIILCERNDPNHEPNGILKKLLRSFLYSIRKNNYFVFQTHYAQKYFNKKIQKKSCIIFNPIKKDLPVVEKEPSNITCVARLTEDKNIPLLINAYSKICRRYDCHLQIFGRGHLYENLVHLVNVLGITDKVEFMGFRSNVHQYMRNSKIFVLPSNYEGISNALIEAMAMGIPCISTDSPAYGARELIKNDVNGYLIECDNEKKLINCIVELLEDNEKWNRISINSYKIREILDEDKIVNQWNIFIKKVLKNEI